MEDLGRTGISRGSMSTPTCCQTVEVHEFFWTTCWDKKREVMACEIRSACFQWPERKKWLVQEEQRCTGHWTAGTPNKTAMQHVSRPNVLMFARSQRLGRKYEGKVILVWCCSLQDMPNAMLIELHIGVELEIDQRWRSQAQSAHMALKVCHASHSGSECWRVGVLRHWRCRIPRIPMESLPPCRDEPLQRAGHLP